MRLSSILFFSLILSLIGCKEESDYDRLSVFLEQEFNFGELDNYEYLIVVNEMGNCLNCNDAFAKVMSNFKENSKILYVVSGQGLLVDISYYIFSEDQSNILIDPSNKFAKLNLVNKCAVISIKDRNIESVNEIKLDNLELSLEIFSEKFK